MPRSITGAARPSRNPASSIVVSVRHAQGGHVLDATRRLGPGGGGHMICSALARDFHRNDDGGQTVQPAISIHDLAKRYRSSQRADRTALLGLTLDVPPGEIYGFLGPNGAGKTTTIKLLLGLIRPTGGGGAVLGHPLGSVETRRRLGFLPESPYFYEYLRGDELLHYYGSLFRLPDRIRRGRVEELLRLVGLWEHRRL